MNLHVLHKFLCLFLMLGYVELCFSNVFPLRDKYKDIPVIELGDLTNSKNDAIIIDVRSKAEFSVIHIAKAKNIPISNMGFVQKIKKIRENNPKEKIVFYCNGHTCAKSYKAAKKIMEQGVENCYAFDAGIFDWVKKNPNDSVLLGETPASLDKLISDAEFKAHLLSYDDFKSRLEQSEYAEVIDIRESMQRAFIPTFKSIKNIRFLRLSKSIKNKKFIDKPLFIFDAVGKQIRWLQYYLKNNGYKNYFFLKGGVKAIPKG